MTTGEMTSKGDAATGNTDVAFRPTPRSHALDARECRALDGVRRFGTIGSLLLATGSLGAGAAPVFNPLPGVPVLGVFARIPTVALACAFSGMLMLIVGWLLLGRFAYPGRPRIATRAQLSRTLLMWAVPLMLIPPLFSRDVYSYLAQSEIVHQGLDPYTQGPADALGVGDPLTRGVSNMWRDTPAPYGPLFLSLGSVISAIAGDHVVVGVLLQRILALGGVVLIIWALPRLAKRFGVHPSTALWLGAVNPLVLFHLIAGAHNDALGIGLLMAGLELGLRWLPVRRPGEKPPPRQRYELLGIVLGAVVITLGAAVKVQAAAGLPFLGVIVARRWGGTYRDLFRSACLQLSILVTTMVTFCMASGLGFGWIGALDTPSKVRSWISPLSELANIGGVLGVLLGMGNHTTAVLDTMYLVGNVVAASVTAWLLWEAFHGRRHPIVGIGVALGVFSLLHSAMQPWYLLWAVIPMAAAAGNSRFRKLATVISAILALLTAPTGSTFEGRGYMLGQAYVAGIVVLLIGLFLLHRKYPLLTSWPRNGRTIRTA